MIHRQNLILVFTFFIFSACNNFKKSSDKISMNQKNQDEIKYRPQIHFSPKENWMNDPNGMFYYKGKYHLYFQHNPNANVWGPMHWGHAISEDLVSWEQQPIALFPDDLGTIFSGSAVVDLENTSGFGTKENPPIVAVYTNHNSKEEKNGSKKFQNQSIAYSLDEGQTWTKYNQNPVIKNPGMIDFRDPKVFWYERQNKWVLTLAAGQQTQFYESNDLKNWSYLSSFGKGIGNHKGVWECPDFFELPVEGSKETKWVHLVSINPGGPNGGSATQYFIGDFDGTNFFVDPYFEKQMKINHNFWTDFGKDNYAGVTYSNWKSEKKGVLFQGWMSNWQYAGIVPTTTWRSAMTLTRELGLFKTKKGLYRLRSKNINSFEKYTTQTIQKEKIDLNKNNLLISEGKIDFSSAKVELEIQSMNETKYNFILSNKNGDSLSFGYDHKEKLFFVDRSRTGNINFSKNFALKPSIATRIKKDRNLKMEFILDKSSIELFYDDGISVLTEIFFSNSPYETLSLNCLGSGSSLKKFKLQEIKTE